MEWAYGITTVPERLSNVFPRTLASLKAGGFDQPRIFVDGASNSKAYDHFGLPITTRWPIIRTYGNWMLSMAELYIRNPRADRYALFQDDFVTCRNLRAYLTQLKYPTKGYFNLYSFPENEALASPKRFGFHLSNQKGKGAVALVFNREAVTILLQHHHIIAWPQRAKGWAKVDGAIVEAFRRINWKEFVHNPSLVQHTGAKSSMGSPVHPLSGTFPGEDFDALDFLSPDSVEGFAVDDWQIELDSLLRAKEEDAERLRATTDPAEISKLRRLLSQYESRIRRHHFKKRYL